MTRENTGLCLGAIAVCAFALTLPATRHLVEILHPVFIGFGRAFFAGCLALFILLIAQQPRPDVQQLFQLTIVSLGVVVGFPVLSAMAMQNLPAAHGGVILAILPLATAAAGVLVSAERPSAGFWLMSILGAGLVITFSVLRHSPLEQQLAYGVADGILLMAVISAAVGYAVGAKLASEMGGWQVICWALVLALPFLAYPTILGTPLLVDEPKSNLLTHGLITLRSIPLSGLVSFLYLTLVSQLVGFFFWYRGLALGGIARVSQLQLIQPFITIAASALLLGEAIDALTIAFALGVVTVVALGKRL